MTAPLPIPTAHIYFACGCVTDVAGFGFYRALPTPRSAAKLHPAQKLAIYMLVTACGVSAAQVGRAYGVDGSSVSRICTDIVDQREANPIYDRSLSAAERECMATLQPRMSA